MAWSSRRGRAIRSIRRKKERRAFQLRIIDRALDVLETLSRYPEGVGIMNLSEMMSEPSSSLHRLLAALIARGHVVQDTDSKRYRLGPATMSLAYAYLGYRNLQVSAWPVMQGLSAELDEAVFLSEMVADDVVCIAACPSPRPFSYYIRVGQRMPLHASASARAILAFEPLELARRRLEYEQLAKFTASTPDSIESVLKALEHVRKHGYAMCNEEMEPGLTALAAPIRDVVGRAIASIAVVAPSGRVVGPRQKLVAMSILRSASLISEAVGYAPGAGTANGGRPRSAR